MGILVRMIPLIIILVSLVSILDYRNALSAEAQNMTMPVPSTSQPKNEIFQNANDSFGIEVPRGWIIDDVSNGDAVVMLNELMDGIRTLAQLCPQEQGVSDAGNTHNCDEAQDRILINQYPDLANSAEFSSLSGGKVGLNEQFLEYQKQKLQELGYGNINVLNNTKTPIEVKDTQSNKTIATVPANLIELSYTVNSTEARGYYLLAVTNATSDFGIISGYSISYDRAPGNASAGSLPEPVSQVMQSFKFVKQEHGINNLEGNMARTNSSLIPGTSSNISNDVTNLLKLHPNQTRGE
jgi:hypothetical protein